MATEQLPVKNELRAVKTVEPKDFNIIWGDNTEYWRLPTKDDPTAELLKVSWIDVTAKIEMPQLESTAIVVVFDVCKTANSSGWETAQVELGVKQEGWNGYHTRNIMSQVNKMKPGERTEVFFDLRIDTSVASTLHIGFFDTKTTTLKEGMIFYGAKVLYNDIIPTK